MSDRIRIIHDCFALRTPHPDGERLFRFAAGSELRLLEDFNRDYFRAAHEGQLVYVPKESSYRVPEHEGAPTPVARVVAGPPPPGSGAPFPSATGAPPSAPWSAREGIRVISSCLGLSEPRPEGAARYRFLPGSELPLLSERGDYFQSTYEGRTVFLPKALCQRLERWDASAKAPVHAIPAGAAVRRASRRGESGFVKALRGLAVLAGLYLTITGLGLIIAGPAIVLVADVTTGSGYGLGIGGAVALLFGLGFIRLGVRPLLQFAIILGGVILGIAGVNMLIWSIPLPQLTDPDINTERGRVALLAGGGSLLLLGLGAAGVAALRWWRNPASRQRLPEVARWAAIAYGGLLLLAGLAVAGSISLTAEGFEPTLFDAGWAGAGIALFLVPGAILAFYGLTMQRPRLNAPFRFFPSWPIVLLFGGALALGGVISAIDGQIWLMTSAHAGAALLPALALIALASRGGLRGTAPAAALTHRQLWLALAVGIAVVTLVAGVLDGLLIQALQVAIFTASGAFRETGAIFAPENYLSRAEMAFLLIMIVVVIAPVMEEGFKAFGVSLLLPRRPTPTPSQALTLGVAVGAGFGVTEASLYGLGGLYPDSGIDWWALMLLRGGATTMHALNTGLLGLALYFGAAERRLRRSIGLYFAAVAIHGLWNALAVLLGTRVIFRFDALSDTQHIVLVSTAFAALALVALAALHEIARRAYRVSPKLGGPAREPAVQPVFEPWVGV